MDEREFSVNVTPNFKIWIEYRGKPILGEEGATLLKNIEKYNNLSKAAERSGFSYRYAWNYLKRIQRDFKIDVVKTHRGGYGGGGGMKLTKLGKMLLKRYERFENFLKYALQNPELWEALGLRSTDKNKIKGQVMEVIEGKDSAMIKVRVSPPVYIVSIITRAAAEELQLREGDSVKVVVKATEAMVDVVEGEGQ